MKRCFEIKLIFGFLLIFMAGPVVYAQANEFAVLVGHLNPTDRGLTAIEPIKAAFDGSVTFQFNYANRIVNGGLASVHWELLIAYAPSIKGDRNNPVLPEDYDALYFTPGLKLKLIPGAGISPYIVVGGGLARYSSSDILVSGLPNPAGDRSTITWALNYGGGVDLNFLGVVALRGEIRDFVTGNPKINVPLDSNRQHNIFIGGGIVFRF